MAVDRNSNDRPQVVPFVEDLPNEGKRVGEYTDYPTGAVAGSSLGSERFWRGVQGLIGLGTVIVGSVSTWKFVSETYDNPVTTLLLTGIVIGSGVVNIGTALNRLTIMNSQSTALETPKKTNKNRIIY